MSTARERSGIKQAGGKLVAVEVGGERLVIDQAAMTIKERQLARGELAKLPTADDVDGLAAQIWIAMRRTNATLTFDEVCDQLTVGFVDSVEMVEDDQSGEA